MPQFELRLAALVQSLSDELHLAEALLFPGASCLADRPARLREMLARRVREIVRRLPAGTLYRQQLADLPELRQVQVEVPPIRDDYLRQQPVTLTLHYVQWRHAADAAIAAVPALGIEVLAENERQLEEQLVPQIRSALARRKSAQSLRDLVLLGRTRELRIKPLRLKLNLPTLKQAAQQERDAAEKQKSVLKEVATDVGRQAYKPVYERGELVGRLAKLLTARTPRSVLLVGSSGVGKSALVRELARRRGELGLPRTPLWSTSGSRLVAGMSGFGMWQERCQKLIREAAKTKAVVHLDNLVELIEVGKGGGNAQGIATMLRPAIARGTLLTIAECTPEQLALVERDEPQLLEAFVPLDVPVPTPDQTRAILAQAAADATSEGLPSVSPGALAELDRLHRRYATYSAAPGRPLRFLRNLQEDRRRDGEIGPADVTAAFSHETGLPLFMLDDAVPLDLAATRDWFRQRVIGQPEPVELATEMLAAVKAGLARGGKPIASLLFIGPTGVGKTEMAKGLAEFLYQDAARMIRFDMSEYATAAAVERLIGGAYTAQGLLTQKVRDQPFMVVLLDEFEKAHPALFDVLLSVLGEGRLTDGAGRVADFTNAVVIMTSNLGAESFRRAAVGFGGTAAAADAAGLHFEREVKAFLRPEMFNRLDRIVPFAPLSPETISRIARREIDRLSQRDGLRLRDLKLAVSVAATDHLAAGGYDPRYGARPLKRAIERQLVAPLAERLGRYGGDLAIDCRVEMVAGELVVDTTATPTGQGSLAGASPTAIEELNLLVHLRRQVQRLQRSGAVLRLRNEIIRLKQAERERLRKLRRRGQPERFAFTPEQARVLAQEGLLDRIDKLEGEACRLEDSLLGDLYAGRPIAASALRQRPPHETALQEILFELHKVHSEFRKRLTIAIYGVALDRVLELADAYEHVCAGHPVNLSRYWLKMYDQSLDNELRRSLDRTQPHDLMPVMHLKSRQRQETDKPKKVVDVYTPPPHQFRSPTADVIGIALQIQGDRPVALLQTETGRHEFLRGSGKPEVCFVETQDDLLLKYDPPADVGRSSAFADLVIRRTYDLPGEICHDRQLNEDFRILGRSIDAVVAETAAAFLSQRTWSLLD